MALSNLRPGITITQQRVTSAPNVQSTSLPAVFVGLNRDIVYREKADVFDWSAGTAANGVSFPGFTLGGSIEAGVTNPQLAPKFYVSNSLGVAEITSSVTTQNLTSGSPSFDIASGISSVFQIATGTLGCFILDSSGTLAAERASQFKDEGADFVFSQVLPGDEIKVSGVTEYVVTGVVSDSELQVRRAGKGPETIGAIEAAKMRLTPEDSNDFRVLEATSQSFIAAGGFGQSGTKVRSGDLIRIDNWLIKESAGGITFDAKGENEGTDISGYIVTADDRVVTLELTHTIDASVPFVTTTGAGLVFFLANEQGEDVPAFYSAAAEGTGVSSNLVPVKMFESNVVDDTQDADSGVGNIAIKYSAVAGATASDGSFTIATNGERTFSSAAVDFTALTAASATNRYHVMLKGQDGIFRPVFNVTNTGTLPADLTVTQFSAAELSTSTFAENVEFALVAYDETAGTAFEQGGVAAVTAAYSSTGSLTAPSGVDISAEDQFRVAAGGARKDTLSAEERFLTVVGENFSISDADLGVNPPPAVSTYVDTGDLIFSSSGTLLFEVTGVPYASADASGGSDSQESLIVKPASNAGLSYGEADTFSNYGITVRQGGNRSDFVVRRVISDSQLEVQEKADSPNPLPDSQAVQGFIYYADSDLADPQLPVSVVAPDTTVNLSYTIDKTVSGSDLEGDILVTYAAIRNDIVGAREITVQDYEAVVGPAVPDNPLGLAAQLYFSNTNNTAFVAQVQEDSEAGWTAAFGAIETDAVYQVIPLTNDPEYIGMAQAHVIAQSTPIKKKERILWQSYRFEQNTVLVSYLASDDPRVSRASDGTVTVQITGRDLGELGVIAGDDFSGTWSNGLVTSDFSGRIQRLDITGNDTTLTLLADGNVPLNTSNMVVTDYTVRSRPLSLAEQKEDIKDYPAGINNRRIRNIYPDQVMIDFTDRTGDGETTGFYGGGEQQATVGAFYVGGLEAAKRTVFGPAAPLTKRGSAGILKVLDPFAAAPGFQDEIIDAGNYYIEMQAGDGSNVQAIRALTTSVADLTEAEESITPQIDTFVRRLRAQLTPFLGPEVLDQRFFDIVSAQAQSVVTSTLRERQLKELRLLEIVPSPDAADTFLMRYQAVPFFSGARAEVTITF